MKNALLLLALLFLGGCGGGSSLFTQETYDKIKPGMTLQEVKAILGDPSLTQDVNVDIPSERVSVPGLGSTETMAIKSDMTTLHWGGPGMESITIELQDGKLISKAKMGF